MPERLLVAADAVAVAVLRRSAAGVTPLAQVQLSGQSPADLLEATGLALESTAGEGGHADVWLGSSWARLLAIDWPAVALDRAESRALLAHAWTAVIGDTAGWRLLVAERGSPRLGVALPEMVVIGLAEQLRQRRVAARSLLPAICGALQRRPQAGATAVLDEGDRVSIAVCDERGDVRAISSRRRRPEEDIRVSAAETAGSGRLVCLPMGVGAEPACVRWGGLWA